MDLNSIINNDDVSVRIQDIYKYIKNNDSVFDDILNHVYTDLQTLYPNTKKEDNKIEIYDVDNTNIIIERNNCHNVLSHHCRQVLKENAYLLSYAFKINTYDKTISISRKR